MHMTWNDKMGIRSQRTVAVLFFVCNLSKPWNHSAFQRFKKQKGKAQGSIVSLISRRDPGYFANVFAQRVNNKRWVICEKNSGLSPRSSLSACPSARRGMWAGDKAAAEMQRCYTEPSPSLSALMGERARKGGEQKKAASAGSAGVSLCL